MAVLGFFTNQHKTHELNMQGDYSFGEDFQFETTL